jgi:hypothetical protein
MDKFKKIDKDFLLTDSSLNSYSYRLLTSGYLMDEFKKNPIGYYLHADPDNTEYTRKDGVLVKWEDIRKDGDKVYGKPCINLSHSRGQKTVDEIESGFLNAASMGHFVVLEVSDKPEDYLPNQKSVTVSKWFNRECSLVDIPGNYNALTNLFDENNNPLKLEDLLAKQNNQTMKQVFFTPAQLAALNCKAEDDAAAVETAFANLIAKAAKVDSLTSDLTAANSAKTIAEDALKAFKKTTVETQVNDLLDKALNVDKKITAKVKDELKTTYAENPIGLKSLIDALPAYVSISDALNNNNADKVKDLAAKSWSELDKEGKLEDLKANDLPTFKAKYKEQFHKEYEGK